MYYSKAHRELPEHYSAVVAKHEVETKEQVEPAAKYRANPTAGESKRPGAPDTALHCVTYIERCRKAAKPMSEMADMREEMAKNFNRTLGFIESKEKKV